MKLKLEPWFSRSEVKKIVREERANRKHAHLGRKLLRALIPKTPGHYMKLMKLGRTVHNRYNRMMSDKEYVDMMLNCTVPKQPGMYLPHCKKYLLAPIPELERNSESLCYMAALFGRLKEDMKEYETICYMVALFDRLIEEEGFASI